MDHLLGCRTVGALAGLESRRSESEFLIPNLPQGEYRTWAVADPADEIPEINERNNARKEQIITLSPGPDLTFTEVRSPPGGITGTTIFVGDTICNMGGGRTVLAPVIGYFLAKDADPGSQKIPLGFRSSPAMAPGECASGGVSVILPTRGLTTGSYLLSAVADMPETIFERNEDNNREARVIALTPGPDLQIFGTRGPDEVRGPEEPIFQATVCNTGIGDTVSGFEVAFDLLTEGEPLLPTREPPVIQSVESLAAGRCGSVSSPIRLSTQLREGSYRVRIRADHRNQVSEGNETNNMVFLPLRIFGPDIRIEAIRGPSHGVIGHPIRIQETVNNMGSEPAVGQVLVYYLSVDSKGTVEDHRIGSRRLGTLSPRTPIPGETEGIIPKNLPVGDYYLIGRVEEGDSEDDRREIAMGVSGELIGVRGPDLVPLSLSVDRLARGYRISNRIENRGEAPAGAFTLNYFLSSDVRLDPVDRFLADCSRTVAALGPGEMRVQEGDSALICPDSDPSGFDGYLILSVDHDGVVAETDEANNRISSRLDGSSRLETERTVSVERLGPYSDAQRSAVEEEGQPLG